MEGFFFFFNPVKKSFALLYFFVYTHGQILVLSLVSIFEDPHT